MANDSRSGSLSADQLNNYDLTRKIFAIRNLELMTRLSEAEAAKASPDLIAIASLGTAIAAVLSAVG